MFRKLWVYSKGQNDLYLLSVFKKFRDCKQLSSLDKIESTANDVIIFNNILINLEVASRIRNMEAKAKILISKELDLLTAENADSLFDDIYIGDTRDALIKYLSGVLRGFYD